MIYILRKYLGFIITIGALICFVEFLSIGYVPPETMRGLVGALHLTASVFLVITLMLYVSTWRMGWILMLRVVFAIIILLMLIHSFQEAMALLKNN